MPVGLILAAILVVVALLFAYFGYRNSSRSGLYDTYVEASTPAELAEGIPSFIRGTIAVAQPLTSEYAKKSCVYFTNYIEELRERTDQNGNKTSEWERVGGSQPSTIPFFIQTPSGNVAVDLTGAEIKATEHFEGELGLQNAPSGVLGGIAQVASALTQGQRRWKEDLIPDPQRYPIPHGDFEPA
jgi:hypothetical protein